MYNACSPFWDKICTLIGYIRKKFHFEISPINVQCLSVYTDKHCTLIGDTTVGIVPWLVTLGHFSKCNQSVYDACP